MKKYVLHLILIPLIIVAFGCKQKGNLPGIDATIPVFPKAVIGESTEEKVFGVHSGNSYKVHSVAIITDSCPEEVLEFYKASLTPIKINDYGGYYAVGYRPDGFDADDRIEIQIPKNQDSENPGYIVAQFKQ